MALASVLRSELPEFHKSLSGLPKTFPGDSEDSPGIPEILKDPPGPPRFLAAPPLGVRAAPDGPGLELLHGTTTLAFKVKKEGAKTAKIPFSSLKIPFETQKSRFGGVKIHLKVPRTRKFHGKVPKFH